MALHQCPKKYEQFPGFRIDPNIHSIKSEIPKVAISAIQVQCELSEDGTTIKPNITGETHIFICCTHFFSLDENEWKIDLDFLNGLSEWTF